MVASDQNFIPGATGTNSAERRKRDLEDQIDILRELDEQRRKSADLRDYGIRVLEWLYNRTDREKFEKVLYYGLIDCFSRHSAGNYEDLSKNCRDKAGIFSALKLEEISKHDSPVLFAACGLQACVATPGMSYSKAALLCYYYIAREMYTADAPRWSIGGIRESPEDQLEESPRITAQCVRAILRFIEHQEASRHYIACLRERDDQIRRLKSPSHEHVQDWTKIELSRVNVECFITLKRCASKLVFPVRSLSPSDLENAVLTKEIIRELKSTADTISDSFKEVINEITRYWRKEKRNKPIDSRTLFGHERALLAISSGLDITKTIQSSFTNTTATDDTEENFAHHQNVFQSIEEGLERAAKNMRGMLLPAANYLENVLDHELVSALVYGRAREPARIVTSASALLSLDKRRGHDKKIKEAVSFVYSSVSDTGEFPIPRPERTRRESLGTPFPMEAIEAFAGLLRLTIGIPSDEVVVDLTRRMLRFFEDNRARDLTSARDVNDLPVEIDDPIHAGWHHPFHEATPHFDPQTTIVAVNALAAINRMLDEKINDTILKFFSVKKPGIDLDSRLNLNSLFYPDYGLVSEKKNTKPISPPKFEKQWPDHFGREDSIAVTLQKMRAHIQRISLGPEVDLPCSVALHGPPGTGKTTLVEALAQTCDVPLVEVTPSDIIVGGEEAVERRARAVFEALRFLTRVVILFDEFDPVLWDRDPESNERSVFTFLTPGMLPKLKDLRKSAKKRSVAFVLSTNLISRLDDAAIREGRFDEKIGIYPPDPLSRAGRLLNHWDMFCEAVQHSDSDDTRKQKYKSQKEDSVEPRILDILKYTSHGAMESLGKPGWFSMPDPSKKLSSETGGEKKSGNPFDCMYNCNLKCEQTAQEAFFDIGKKEKLKKKIAILEFGQWWWLHKWEKNIETAEDLKTALEARSSFDEFEKLMEN
ncbi:ATP-binding protein [Methylocystis sp. 9N]|uniref:ATP-binding protein n=1 Tax=Methylocystis borbori TaxID=3118750 RepID=A0ABU7XGB0_9HYPH